MEELKQRFSMSLAAQSELQDQLSETRSHLGQMELVRDLKSDNLGQTIQISLNYSRFYTHVCLCTGE